MICDPMNVLSRVNLLHFSNKSQLSHIRLFHKLLILSVPIEVILFIQIFLTECEHGHRAVADSDQFVVCTNLKNFLDRIAVDDLEGPIAQPGEMFHNMLRMIIFWLQDTRWEGKQDLLVKSFTDQELVARVV